MAEWEGDSGFECCQGWLTRSSGFSFKLEEEASLDFCPHHHEHYRRYMLQMNPLVPNSGPSRQLSWLAETLNNGGSVNLEKIVEIINSLRDSRIFLTRDEIRMMTKMGSIILERVEEMEKIKQWVTAITRFYGVPCAPTNPKPGHKLGGGLEIYLPPTIPPSGNSEFHALLAEYENTIFQVQRPGTMFDLLDQASSSMPPEEREPVISLAQVVKLENERKPRRESSSSDESLDEHFQAELARFKSEQSLPK